MATRQIDPAQAAAKCWTSAISLVRAEDDVLTERANHQKAEATFHALFQSGKGGASAKIEGARDAATLAYEALGNAIVCAALNRTAYLAELHVQTGKGKQADKKAVNLLVWERVRAEANASKTAKPWARMCSRVVAADVWPEVG